MKKSFQKISEFQPYSGGEVTCVSIGKTGQIFLTGGTKGEVTLFQILTSERNGMSLQEVTSLPGFSKRVTCVKFNDAEDQVLAGTIGGSVRVWSFIEKNQQRARLYTPGHRSNVTVLSWSYDSKYFATGSFDTNIKLWHIEKKKSIKLYNLHREEISALEFSPDGKILVSGDNKGVIYVWFLENRSSKPKHELKGHKSRITTFFFHPNDTVLASGSKDKTSSLWDVDVFVKIGRTGMTTTSISKVMILDGVEGTKDENSKHEKLICLYKDQVKIWKWEPMVLVEEYLMKWNDLQDAVYLVDFNKILIIDKGKDREKGRLSTWTFNLGDVHVTNESLTHVLPSEKAKERVKGSGAWLRDDNFSVNVPKKRIRSRPASSSTPTQTTNSRNNRSPVRKNRSPVRKSIPSPSIFGSNNNSDRGRPGSASNNNDSNKPQSKKKNKKNKAKEPVDEDFEYFLDALGFKGKKKIKKGVRDVSDAQTFMDLMILRNQNSQFFRKLWRKKLLVKAVTPEEKEKRIDEILKFQFKALIFLETTGDPGLSFMVMTNVFRCDIRETLDIIHDSVIIEGVSGDGERKFQRKKIAEKLFAKLLSIQLEMLRSWSSKFMICAMNNISELIKSSGSKRSRNWKKVFSVNERIVGFIRAMKEEIMRWRIEEFGSEVIHIGENLFGELIKKI